MPAIRSHCLHSSSIIKTADGNPLETQKTCAFINIRFSGHREVSKCLNTAPELATPLQSHMAIYRFKLPDNSKRQCSSGLVSTSLALCWCFFLPITYEEGVGKQKKRTRCNFVPGHPKYFRLKNFQRKIPGTS